MRTFYLTVVVVFASNIINAQKISDKLNNTSTQVNSTANSVENAANTAGKVLDLGKNLFGSKKKKHEEQNNTSSKDSSLSSSENNHEIVLKGIDYENPIFGLIFTKVKSFKGVSSSKKSLEGNEGIIYFNFAGDISEIWDSLDEKTKQSFKVEKITENNIKVIYKGR